MINTSLCRSIIVLINELNILLRSLSYRCNTPNTVDSRFNEQSGPKKQRLLNRISLNQIFHDKRL